MCTGIHHLQIICIINVLYDGDVCYRLFINKVVSNLGPYGGPRGVASFTTCKLYV